MFIQIIEGPVSDAERFAAEADRWVTDLKPGAIGYLGCTWDIASDGTAFMAARFESEQAAKTNSERPEQGEWWSRVEPIFDEVSFKDCPEVDTMMGGGSNDAGFVQVIEGRVKDQDEARATMRGAESELAESRPDILGGLMAWHGADGTFTQIVYFRSEDDARAGETSETESGDRYQEMMADEPTFIDLTDPHFD